MKRLSDLHPKITDNNKRDLYKVTEGFIERTWQDISKDLFTDDLGLGKLEIDSYLKELKSRGSAFPWAWMRARCEEAVIKRLKITDDTTEYIKLLRKNGKYWFRETPYQHLKLGYHTAISAFWKMLGGGHALYLEKTGEFTPGNRESLLKVARMMATFNLEMLLALDGVLWDGAAANPLELDILPDGEPRLNDQTIELVKNKFTNPSQRLGCPALRTTAFSGIQYWCEKVFDEIYLKNLSKPQLISG